MSGAGTALVAVTAGASGVLGGTLFAFSSFVMPGLRRLPADQGIAAMQALNDAAPRSLLMVPLLASAAGSAAVGIHATVAGTGPDRWIRVAGAVLGVAAFAVTAGANIPRNDALGMVDPTAPTAAAHWAAYVTEWSRWNHARTIAALASAGLLVWSWVRSG